MYTYTFFLSHILQTRHRTQKSENIILLSLCSSVYKTSSTAPLGLKYTSHVQFTVANELHQVENPHIKQECIVQVECTGRHKHWPIRSLQTEETELMDFNIIIIIIDYLWHPIS